MKDDKNQYYNLPILLCVEPIHFYYYYFLFLFFNSERCEECIGRKMECLYTYFQLEGVDQKFCSNELF